MNVLYLHKKSNWGCNELRYSLRSVEKYADFDKVYVAGHKPDWLQNVEHIGCKSKSNKYEDVIHKLKRAVSQIKSDEILLMHDDMYLLEPYKPFVYYNGLLKDRMKRTDGDRRTVFENTLKALGEDSKNYSLHYPMPFNRIQAYGSTLSMLLDGYHPFSYMNLFGALNNQYLPKEANDCKFYNESITLKKLEGLPCFSTGNENDRLLHLFEQLYPTKSQFEQ